MFFGRMTMMLSGILIKLWRAPVLMPSCYGEVFQSTSSLNSCLDLAWSLFESMCVICDWSFVSSSIESFWYGDQPDSIFPEKHWMRSVRRSFMSVANLHSVSYISPYSTIGLPDWYTLTWYEMNRCVVPSVETLLGCMAWCFLTGLYALLFPCKVVLATHHAWRWQPSITANPYRTDSNWLTDSWSEDYMFIMLTASVLVPLFAQHKHLLGWFWLSLAGLQ
jgi:hypothetical protein